MLIGPSIPILTDVARDTSTPLRRDAPISHAIDIAKKVFASVVVATLEHTFHNCQVQVGF